MKITIDKDILELLYKAYPNKNKSWLIINLGAYCDYDIEYIFELVNKQDISINIIRNIIFAKNILSKLHIVKTNYLDINDVLKDDFLHFNDKILQNFSDYFTQDSDIKIVDSKIIQAEKHNNSKLLDDTFNLFNNNLTDNEKYLFEEFQNNKYNHTEISKSIKKILKKYDSKLFKYIEKIVIKNEYINQENLSIADLEYREKLFTLIAVNKKFIYDNESGFLIQKDNLKLSDIIEKIDNYFSINELDFITKEELLNLIPYAKHSLYNLLIEKCFYKEKNNKCTILLENNKMYDAEFKEAINNMGKFTNREGIKFNLLKILKENLLVHNNPLKYSEIAIKLNLNPDKYRKDINGYIITFVKDVFDTLPIKLLRFVNLKLAEDKLFLIPDLQLETNSLRYILATMFCILPSKSYRYNKELNAIVLNSNYEYKKIVKKIDKNILEFKNKFIDNMQLEKILDAFFPENEELLKKVLLKNKDLYKIKDDKYLFPLFYNKDYKKIEFIYYNSENGYDYDEIELVQKKIKSFFKSDTPIYSKDMKSAICNKYTCFILWGYGGSYCHKNNLDKYFEKFNYETVLEYIDEQLEKSPYLNLLGYFQDNKKYLKERGIETKEALHSLLKYHDEYKDRYDYLLSPIIVKKGLNITSFSDVIILDMTEQRAYSLDELKEKYRVEDYHIDNALKEYKEIVTIKQDTYMKRVDLNISSEQVEQIASYLNDTIDYALFYYPDYILNKFEDLLTGLHLYKKEDGKRYILLDILRKHSKNDNFRVSNNFRVVSKKYFPTDKKEESLNYHTIIKKHFLDKCIDDLNQIIDFFQKRGFSKNDFMTAFVRFDNNKLLVVRKDYSTIMSLEMTGLVPKQIKSINKLVEKELLNNSNLEIILKNIKPKLPSISIEWNKYILYDILSKDIFSRSPEVPIILKLKKD